VESVAAGLWSWTAPHPDWTPDEGGPDGWEQEVACLAFEGEDALVLIDPLIPVGGPEEQELWTELDAIASPRRSPIAVLLTVFWHERSAGHVMERYSKTLGARIFAHDSAVRRLECPVTDPFTEGDELPGGITAFEAERADEVVLWLPRVRALAVGDVLLGREGGLRLCPPSWIGGDEALAHVRSSLQRLLDLPVEQVLVSHGPPVRSNGRVALAAALESQEA
jgi:glyoxylase-like metal-dependent hydrolase (beta-lactamase superfamily II)